VAQDFQQALLRAAETASELQLQSPLPTAAATSMPWSPACRFSIGMAIEDPAGMTSQQDYVTEACF